MIRDLKALSIVGTIIIECESILNWISGIQNISSFGGDVKMFFLPIQKVFNAS